MGCLGRRHCRGHSFCPTGEVGGVTASLRKHRVSSQVRAVVTRGGLSGGSDTEVRSDSEYRGE